MEYKQILEDLKNKKYKPVYFLQGEEGYFIDKITEYIEDNVLDESEKDFNQSVVYGKDISIQDIASNAKRFPMMAPYQVVVVKEAQHLSRTIDQLETYVHNPTPTTILVINYKYKKLDGRKPLGKLLKKQGMLFTSEKIKDYKLPDWIVGFCRSQGLNIKPKASHLLSEFLGNDLSKVSNTIEKLKDRHCPVCNGDSFSLVSKK